MGRLDLTNKRFGRLVALDIGKVVQKEPRSAGTIIFWRCKCDCGNEVLVRVADLTRGITKSCGCLQKERAKQANTRHGLTHSHLQFIWTAMKQRCHNKNNKNFKEYGARGIKVCNEWLEDFKNFCDWSFQNGYRDGLTIDRFDNNGNYCPENCRWVDRKKQMNNTRRNVFITFNDETKTISEWASKLGFKPSLIRDRLKWGWTIEKALTTPVKPINRKAA